MFALLPRIPKGLNEKILAKSELDSMAVETQKTRGMVALLVVSASYAHFIALFL